MSRQRGASGDVVRVPAGDVEVRAPVARPVEGRGEVPQPQVVYVPMPVQPQPQESRPVPSSGVQVLALLVAVVAAFALGAYVLTAPPWQDDRPAVQQERGR